MTFQQLAVSVVLFATSVQGAPESEIKLRFGQVATRAVANFRSADSIEGRLNAQGMTLHPQLIALRLRIESALDETEGDIRKGDLEAATEALTRASALVERYVRILGGA